MGACRPPLALRVLGVAIPAAVTGAIWILAAAMFVTGAVLWRDWHSLAREGVDQEARIDDCEWRSMRDGRRADHCGGYGARPAASAADEALAPPDAAHHEGAQGDAVHGLRDHPGRDRLREVHLQAVARPGAHHTDAVNLGHAR
jgi:hypothetical protein